MGGRLARLADVVSKCGTTLKLSKLTSMTLCLHPALHSMTLIVLKIDIVDSMRFSDTEAV